MIASIVLRPSLDPPPPLSLSLFLSLSISLSLLRVPIKILIDPIRQISEHVLISLCLSGNTCQPDASLPKWQFSTSLYTFNINSANDRIEVGKVTCSPTQNHNKSCPPQTVRYGLDPKGRPEHNTSIAHFTINQTTGQILSMATSTLHSGISQVDLDLFCFVNSTRVDNSIARVNVNFDCNPLPPRAKYTTSVTKNLFVLLQGAPRHYLFAYVSELLAPGSPLLTFNISIKDERTKVNKTASIVSVSSVCNANESILSLTTRGLGQSQVSVNVSLARSLQWQAQQSHTQLYTCYITAKDDCGQASLYQLNIPVRDENESPPRFLSNGLNITLNETVPAGSMVARVTCVDDDNGLIHGLNLSILSGNEDDLFDLQVSPMETILSNPRNPEKYGGLIRGELRTRRKLYWQESIRTLTLLCHDIPYEKGTLNGDYNVSQNATSDVVFTVHPIGLKILQNQSTALRFVENEAIDYAIYQVKTFCPPLETTKCSESQAPVVEIVSGNTGGKFFVNCTTESCVVFTNGLLDREQTSFYSLLLRVVGEPRDSFRLNITVLDVNDNYPTINVSVASNIYAPSNSPIGRPIANFSVTDTDDGPNGIVSLKIAGGVRLLNIHEVTPPFSERKQLVLARSLDALQGTSVTVNFIAEDKGTPPLVASKKVIIHVEGEFALFQT